MKSTTFHLENEEDAHRAGERGWGRRFPVEGQRWGVVYGGRWLSCVVRTLLCVACSLLLVVCCVTLEMCGLFFGVFVVRSVLPVACC